MRRTLPLCLCLVACGVGPNGLDLGPPVAVVKVTPATSSLREGDTLRLIAVTLDAQGNRVTPRKSPKWFTPDVTHASVDTTGLVHGLLAGTAVVWVTADSVTGTAQVTVLSLPVAAVEVLAPAGAIEVGDTARFTALVRDAPGKRLLGTTIRWASSDTTRARMDSTGLLQARDTGSVTVTASVDSVSGSAGVRVLVPVASVTIAPDSLPLQYDDTGRLTVTLRDSTGAVLPPRPVLLSVTGDSQAITVSPDLVVSAVDAGRAVVTMTAGHASGRAVVDVAALVLTAVTLGSTHSCGLRSDGAAFCWGDGSTGALGRSDTLSAPRPRRVGGGLLFSQLSAGDRLTCGLTPPGAAYCWGRNEASQAGSTGGSPCTLALDVFGTPTLGVCVLTPTAVQGTVSFATIAAGVISSCGLTGAGAAYCWGAGGILGDSTGLSSATPVAVVGGHLFRDLTRADGAGACARDASGAVYCWGLAPVVNDTGYDTLTGWYGMHCGLKGHDLYCFGLIPTSDDGASGNGTVHLLPGTQFSAVSATGDHLCGVTLGGEGVCWGRNSYGQLGDGTLFSTFGSTGVGVSGGHTFTAVEVGGGDPLMVQAHTCGLASDGRVYCWGANSHGQVGRAVGYRAPVPVPPTGQP